VSDLTSETVSMMETDGSKPASWVIRERATGRVIMETFNEHLADTIKPEYEMVPIGRYLASLNTTSRPVMNPPAQAEAGNRVHAAPGQADRDAARRGKTGPSSRTEARPVMPTAHRDDELRSVQIEQYWQDKQGDEYGYY
jgi:hypothetical protein